MAGGLRGRPIERGDHLTLLQPAIAQAEIVIEGNIPPNVCIAEAHNIKTGKAMAVIPTYLALVNPLLPTIEIEAVTSQTNPRLRGAVLFGETPR